MIARSIFNDTYTLYEKGGKEIPIDDNANTISWPEDIAARYKNPEQHPGDNTLYWMDDKLFPGHIENGHLMNWMKIEGEPEFQKLWGKIDENVELPLTVEVLNNFRVSGFKGSKGIVLSTANFNGGKHLVLSYLYLGTGGACMALALVWGIRQVIWPHALHFAKPVQWVDR
eukprot:Platyproteum_vivax@DN16054_c0_g1_i2.p1